MRTTIPDTVCQRGAALVVSLIMLLLLTILGISGMQSTVFEERMAGNARDANTAFQAAEAALRDAEDYLNNNAAIGPFNGTNGFYAQDGAPAPADIEQDANWPASPRSYSASMSGVAAQPTYIIEHLRPAPDPDSSLAADEPLPDSGMYRITARGAGGSSHALSVLQSTFKR